MEQVLQAFRLGASKGAQMSFSTQSLPRGAAAPPPLPLPAARPPVPREAPRNRFVGVLKLLLGIGLTAVGAYLTIYNLGRTSVDLTTSVVVFFAITLGVGVRLLFTGGAQSAGRRLPLLPGLGVFLL